jgi:hypothetical protein
MTHERTFEHELSEWINAGLDEIADRTIDEIESRVRATRQRALWQISLGRASTRRGVRVVLVAAAVLAAITIGFWLVGQPPETIPVPISKPTAAASGALVPTAGSSGAPATAPAAVFHESQFEVPFSVTLVDYWNVGTTTGRWLSFSRRLQTIHISSIATTRVRPPGENVGSWPGSTNVNYDEMDPWPSDIYAWLTANPAFTVTASVSTSIGGRPATVVDFEPATVADSGFYFSAPPLDEETTAYGPSSGIQSRIIEVRTGPNAGIIVYLDGPPARFDAEAAEVDAFLATLTFDSAPGDTNPSPLP